MATVATDKATREWIMNPSDELAAKHGCRFDEERAQLVVDWIETYCHLYEGEHAGELMLLRDWQLECTMRLFGWVRWADEWGRDVRRFRRAGIWVPKKNKKSPTLAAWGLYLLCGDGEQGQKVFSSAKDGVQARIAHRHGVEMVLQSPELLAECSINKNTMQITHEPTRSFWAIVAGDNPNSQEGLNGSVLVDETHVVDSRLMSILKRAGISRSEPLHIEVSTAGKNPDGYGKRQWDYGQQVRDGKIVDQEFFFQEYSAPQDIGDDELEARLIELGQKANPAWGHTVHETEFLADYNSSKVSLSDFADFKTYRLNIWQKSSSPWLKESDWSKCRREYVAEDLRGKTCAAGLDLSKTKDMSALVLVFPMEGERFRLLPYFWMPESEARSKSHLAPFLQWAKDGWLELTPGDVIDYGFIRTRFRSLASMFNVAELAYDKTYAEETTQALEQGVIDADGNEIEKGTGVRRWIFPQTAMTFAGPTADFERLVIAGLMEHPGNPVLDWQAGHVQVRRDPNGNKRPIKPKADDVKKIDGIVAAIMGLSRATQLAGSSGVLTEILFG